MRGDCGKSKRGADVPHLLGKLCNKVISSDGRKGRGEEGREHRNCFLGLEAKELILVR